MYPKIREIRSFLFCCKLNINSWEQEKISVIKDSKSYWSRHCSANRNLSVTVVSQILLGVDSQKFSGVFFSPGCPQRTAAQKQLLAPCS